MSGSNLNLIISIFIQIHKPQKIADDDSDLTASYPVPPADDSPKTSMIMLSSDSHEQSEPIAKYHSEKSTKC